VRIQKLMWRNIMRSIKSQKVSVLHYSIDYRLKLMELYITINNEEKIKLCYLQV
jgi:hypothetical protein